MFKISPIQNPEEQDVVARACGSSYKSDAFAYVMRDSSTNELMGFSQFEIGLSGGVLLDLRPAIGYDDFEAMFILGRATMNFIDMCGAHICKADKDAAEERLLKSIGFKATEDGSWYADMSGMFDGHCGGHTAEEN